VWENLKNLRINTMERQNKRDGKSQPSKFTATTPDISLVEFAAKIPQFLWDSLSNLSIIIHCQRTFRCQILRIVKPDIFLHLKTSYLMDRVVDVAIKNMRTPEDLKSYVNLLFGILTQHETYNVLTLWKPFLCLMSKIESLLTPPPSADIIFIHEVMPLV